MSTLLRLPIVSAESGLSKTTIYARIADGTFPPPVKLGPRAVAWPAHEVAACNDAVIRGANQDAVRTLVKELVTRRAAG